MQRCGDTTAVCRAVDLKLASGVRASECARTRSDRAVARPRSAPWRLLFRAEDSVGWRCWANFRTRARPEVESSLEHSLSCLCRDCATLDTGEGFTATTHAQCARGSPRARSLCPLATGSRCDRVSLVSVNPSSRRCNRTERALDCTRTQVPSHLHRLDLSYRPVSDNARERQREIDRHQRSDSWGAQRSHSVCSASASPVLSLVALPHAHATTICRRTLRPRPWRTTTTILVLPSDCLRSRNPTHLTTTKHRWPLQLSIATTHLSPPHAPRRQLRASERPLSPRLRSPPSRHSGLSYPAQTVSRDHRRRSCNSDRREQPPFRFLNSHLRD